MVADFIEMAGYLRDDEDEARLILEVQKMVISTMTSSFHRLEKL